MEGEAVETVPSGGTGKLTVSHILHLIYQSSNNSSTFTGFFI